MYIDSLEAYVLSPIRTAIELDTEEQEELLAEVTAFRQFRERLEEINPITNTTSSRISSGKCRAATVRSAYYDTVLAVDHYESVYNEELVPNVTAEIGAEAAAVLDPNSSLDLTRPAKQLISVNTQASIETRLRTVEALRAEQESVSQSRSTINGLIRDLEANGRYSNYQSECEADMNKLAKQRQQHLSGRSRGYQLHKLCGYLYQEQPWQYPVLTSIARFGEVVIDNPEYGGR